MPEPAAVPHVLRGELVHGPRDQVHPDGILQLLPDAEGDRTPDEGIARTLPVRLAVELLEIPPLPQDVEPPSVALAVLVGRHGRVDLLEVRLDAGVFADALERIVEDARDVLHRVIGDLHVDDLVLHHPQQALAVSAAVQAEDGRGDVVPEVAEHAAQVPLRLRKLAPRIARKRTRRNPSRIAAVLPLPHPRVRHVLLQDLLLLLDIGVGDVGVEDVPVVDHPLEELHVLPHRDEALLEELNRKIDIAKQELADLENQIKDFDRQQEESNEQNKNKYKSFYSRY